MKAMTAISSVAKRAWVYLRPLWDETLTNQDVANATGLHINTVSKYRNGTVQNPPLGVLFTLREFFEERLGREIKIEDMVRIEDD
jgi:transcriptional regulator with XRE-family HTH domain